MDIATQYILIIFTLAFAFGFVSQKSTLCLTGSIRDGLNDRQWHRMATFVIAVGTALILTSLVEYLQLTQLNDTRPPYRTEQFAWGRYIIGGFIFGVGMMLAMGCGMRNLIKFGQGSYKAFFVLIIMSFTAYLMTRTSIFADYFMPWITPLTIQLSDKATLSSLITDSKIFQLLTGIIIGGLLIFFSLKNQIVRQKKYLINAIIAGAIISLAFVITGGTFGQNLLEHSEFLEQPLEGLGSQSFTFAAPMGDVVYWLQQGMGSHLLSFGVLAVFGLIAGSFASSLLNKNFKIAGFTSKKDILISAIGAILASLGAVTAMGCSIGHGITGVSTLALSSFVALIAILIGGWVGVLIERKLK